MNSRNSPFQEKGLEAPNPQDLMVKILTEDDDGAVKRNIVSDSVRPPLPDQDIIRRRPSRDCRTFVEFGFLQYETSVIKYGGSILVPGVEGITTPEIAPARTIFQLQIIPL
jgi:hypothetical protein